MSPPPLTTLMSMLSALLPGTTAPPWSPPRCTSDPASSRRPDFCSSAPWQATQCFTKMGRTSRAKSTRTESTGPSAAAAEPATMITAAIENRILKPLACSPHRVNARRREALVAATGCEPTAGRPRPRTVAQQAALGRDQPDPHGMRTGKRRQANAAEAWLLEEAGLLSGVFSADRDPRLFVSLVPPLLPPFAR